MQYITHQQVERAASPLFLEEEANQYTAYCTVPGLVLRDDIYDMRMHSPRSVGMQRYGGVQVREGKQYSNVKEK